jgi:SAM-dependent methyltransferase
MPTPKPPQPPQPPVSGGSIPENYDRYLGPYFFEPYAADIAMRLQSSGPGQILEVACGTGRVTAHLQNSLPGATITATDINPDMLAIARQRVEPDRIDWRTADAQDLPFQADSFDAVVCQFGLMFMPDKPLALKEARRVLRPGGHFLFSTWDSLENNPAANLANEMMSGWFPEEPPRFFQLPFSLFGEGPLRELMRDAGLTEIRVSLVPTIGESKSAEELATGLIDGSPIHTQIMSRDPGLLPTIKAALAEALGNRFGTAPLRSPMQAWVLEASK